MNMSQLITRIKLNLGLATIASPMENLDMVIKTIIEEETVPFFSQYQPAKDVVVVDTRKLELISQTHEYQTFLLPDFDNRKLLYVSNVEYDDSTLSGFGHYGYGLPHVGTSLLSQIMMSNATISLYNKLIPKITYHYEHPRKLTLYNQFSECYLRLYLGFEHDKSLASIPDTCLTSFTKLALLDVKMALYSTFRYYSNISSVYGNIDLKIDSWEGAEGERNDLLSSWDDSYHLDMVPEYYA